jgi:hypothetical protein
MRYVFFVMLGCFFSAWTLANDEGQRDAPILITINPESRISVSLVGALPPPAPCGEVTELLVGIVNQGFVTAQLEAEVVGNRPPSAAIDFHPAPLKGVRKELRSLHVILTRPGASDLTISFKAHNGAPDLGGRDRVHLLMRCLSRE